MCTNAASWKVPLYMGLFRFRLTSGRFLLATPKVKNTITINASSNIFVLFSFPFHHHSFFVSFCFVSIQDIVDPAGIRNMATTTTTTPKPTTTTDPPPPQPQEDGAPAAADPAAAADAPPAPSPSSGAPPPGQPPGTLDHRPSTRGTGSNSGIFKSGPLFISSKGIGWTSWKKRWFILTQTSLVFFRSDPSAVPQKGGEVNLTLGGIDLNNSGSVVVKADKKLLTVLFPDGREGRAFTLKAETLEDLYDWKTALENALAQAPTAASVAGQNGAAQDDQAEAADGSSDQSTEKQFVKSMVIGRPILLALEDVDGAPSFLEKALRFVEDHGIKVEGILRQAADVEDVERRIREFEQGKTEFTAEEDGHVIGDCIKYVLRELPSSPVPASCCNALLEARRTDRGGRVNAMRTAICETFPEPNRRLLQRILMMMQTVVAHKADNRMSTSAVAACMAPLLLRPLLAGECEIETDFTMGNDGSAQLLQAAAAANYAQAICITLMEEYDDIFGEGSVSPGLYSDEESGSGTEEGSEGDESYEDDEDYATEGSEAYTDDLENASGSCSESGDPEDDDPDDDKADVHDETTSVSKSIEKGDEHKVSHKPSSSSRQTSLTRHRQHSLPRHQQIQRSESKRATWADSDSKLLGDVSKDRTSHQKSVMQKSTTIANGPGRTIWGRTSAKKNLSMESIDLVIEEDAEIQSLEATKFDLQNSIADEVKENEILKGKLETKKKALEERRLALEKDVARLQEQLQNQRDKRKALEAALDTTQGPSSYPATLDEKTKAELEEIAKEEADVNNLQQQVDDLGLQVNQHLGKNYGSTDDSSGQHKKASEKVKDKQRDSGAAADSERSTSKETNLGDSKSTNSKKSSTKGERGTSTLTKLTARLNFLKDRRSQTTNEPQNKSEGQSSEANAAKFRSQSLQNVDGSRKPDGQRPTLDRGRSEGHVNYDADKSRGAPTFPR